MGKIKTKEFMMSVDELKKKYKIGTIIQENGEKYKVLRIEKPMNTTCFASYPTVIFEKID